MRGCWGAGNTFDNMLTNLIMSRDPEVISIPQNIPSFDDMMWKFEGTDAPKHFRDCSKEELLEVVSVLAKEVQKLQVPNEE